MDIEARKYPIGKFKMPESFPDELIRVMIQDIEKLPSQIKETYNKLSKSQKHLSYRDGGWSALQVLHHIADSHLNAYNRLKLTLTEDNPTVKPYDENLWAALPDANSENAEASLLLIEGIQHKLAQTFSNMKRADFERTFFHPEHQKSFNLFWLISLYHWHGRHHLGHLRIIQNL